MFIAPSLALPTFFNNTTTTNNNNIMLETLSGSTGSALASCAGGTTFDFGRESIISDAHLLRASGAHEVTSL